MALLIPVCIRIMLWSCSGKCVHLHGEAESGMQERCEGNVSAGFIFQPSTQPS